MKSVSSGAVLLPSARKGMATMATAASSGKAWKVTAGALVWPEMQTAQGTELRASRASACAWVASSPQNTRTVAMHASAIQRCQEPVSSWLLRFIVRSASAKARR